MARREGSNSDKKRCAGSRVPAGLGAQPRISDLVAFAAAFLIAYFLVTRGYCVLPWCSSGVLETASAIAAVVGSILSLIWRAVVWFFPGLQGPGGGRRKARRKKRVVLTVVSDDPLPEGSGSAERRNGAGEVTANPVGEHAPQGAGGTDVPAERQPPSPAPTMWPMVPLQPSLPLEPPMAFEGAMRPRDAD